MIGGPLYWPARFFKPGRIVWYGTGNDHTQRVKSETPTDIAPISKLMINKFLVFSPNGAQIRPRASGTWSTSRRNSINSVPDE
jgi:hypothetical protein